MADARSGSTIAQLVAEHHQAAYRYAYRLSGSVQDAEDLTQEVFLVAWRKIGQLRNVDKPRAWLLAILRNCYLKERRRQRPALVTDLACTVDSIRTLRIDADVDRDGLQWALGQLPEASRLVVLMFYFEELSYREIAERLGMPIGTVMSRLARAKRYLRSYLTDAEQRQTARSTETGTSRG